ncbi:MAG: helix-turn-helix transcriptional regulator [Clostridia bacterium]|nr:helix-turn-helix transcriptional regulator [Clostridia bacterium]
MITVNLADCLKREKKGTEIYRPNGSGDYLFIYFPKPMKYDGGGGDIITEENACVLLGPNDMHRFSGMPEFINSFIHFTGNNGEIEEFGLNTGQLFYPNCFERMNEITNLVKSEILTGGEKHTEMTHFLMCELLILIKRSISDKRKDAQLELFESLRFRMLSNCSNTNSAAELAAKVCMSKTQFYKYYRKYFGESPKQELLKARMEKASVLLTDSNKTVAAVAAEVGFENTEHFTRYYKKYFGKAPRRSKKADKTSILTN